MPKKRPHPLLPASRLGGAWAGVGGGSTPKPLSSPQSPHRRGWARHTRSSPAEASTSTARQLPWVHPTMQLPRALGPPAPQQSPQPHHQPLRGLLLAPFALDSSPRKSTGCFLASRGGSRGAARTQTQEKGRCWELAAALCVPHQTKFPVQVGCDIAPSTCQGETEAAATTPSHPAPLRLPQQ